MVSKFEPAQQIAQKIAESNLLYKLFLTTGRVIVKGPDEEGFDNNNDPRVMTEIIPELRRGWLIFDSLFIAPMLRLSRKGSSSMTHGEAVTIWLKENRQKIQKDPNVVIFDKNGPVKK